MAFEKARTSLLNITDRLRRVLGSAGEIPLELSKDLIPVVIAADLRDPGSSSYRGRRFAFVPEVQSISAGFGWVLKLQTDCIIDQLWAASITGGQGVRFWLLDPTTAPVNAPATQVGTWLEGKAAPTSSDRPPIIGSGEVSVNLGGGTPEIAPTSQNLVFTMTQGNACFAVPQGIYVKANSHLIIQLPTTGTVGVFSIGMYARIF